MDIAQPKPGAKLVTVRVSRSLVTQVLTKGWACDALKTIEGLPQDAELLSINWNEVAEFIILVFGSVKAEQSGEIQIVMESK